jgi:cytoskeleton protein RodZ
MDEQVMQDSLFQDPLGLRLKAAREHAGLTREQVGNQLKLPIAIVEAMEREDWERLGAPVYVRSYVGSYLRLLGLPQVLLESAQAARPAPPLVTLQTRSRMRHTIDKSLRNVVYLVMTAVLVVPVVLVARHYQERDRVQELALDPATDATQSTDSSLAELAPETVVALPAASIAGDAGAQPPPSMPDSQAEPESGPAPALEPTPAAAAAEPVMASLAPFPKAADSNGLVLRFRSESWVDVVDAQGRRVERGLVAAGTERRYDAGKVSRVTLGNADGVEVMHAGHSIDLTPFRAANVARFAVSSDGAPAPAAD